MKRRRWQQWAIVGLAFIACRGSLAEQTEARRRSNVQTEVNHLKAEFKITKTRIQTAQDFEAEVTFTNTSGQPLRLNGLFLEIPKVLLKVRRADGTVVSPGPPPFPPADDGVSGRIDLRPGRPVTFNYRGSEYFGSALPPGKYQARFRYENSLPNQGDWTGTIETGWADFEVIPAPRKA